MELRLYAFVNFYLSSIQQGIQTGHAAVDMVRKYTSSNVAGAGTKNLKHRRMVADWADNHKTFITLNGGNAKMLLDKKEIITNEFLTGQPAFPWVDFCEDEDSLGGVMTTVAVVLPASIFNAVYYPSTDSYAYTEIGSDSVSRTTNYYPQHELYPLIQMVKTARLAS